jgi:signal transduction histidine kinase
MAMVAEQARLVEGEQALSRRLQESERLKRDLLAMVSPDHTPIRLQATRRGALAVLAVEDAGPGVPGPDRDRIFERFTQLDSGATRRAGGSGWGCTSPASWPRPRGASCWWASRWAPAPAPASSCASPSPTRPPTAS